MTRDLRRDEPYLSYADFDFQVCCAGRATAWPATGSAWPKCEESLKILHQAVENMPAGPVNVGPDRAVHPAAAGQGLDDDRGPDLALRIGDAQPRLASAQRGSRTAATEAPNGELGFYVVGDGSPRAYRARCRPPSFIHFALFPHLIRGHTLSDVVAVLGSLNIIAAELDR